MIARPHLEYKHDGTHLTFRGLSKFRCGDILSIIIFSHATHQLLNFMDAFPELDEHTDGPNYAADMYRLGGSVGEHSLTNKKYYVFTFRFTVRSTLIMIELI